MTRPTAPFLLRTLGPLLLERTAAEGTPAVVQRGGKPLALLAYLVVERARPVARGALADLLWGDESPESARASLRQAVHALRKLVGEEAIVGDRSEVSLASGHVESDHARFVTAVEAGDMQEAVKWYNGPFCDQLELRAAPRCERWIDAERERLRRLLLRAAERDVTSRRAAGDLRGAARLARSVQSVESTLPQATELAADALIADGESESARTLLDGHRTRLRAAGEESPAGIESRLASLDRARSTRPFSEEARPNPFDLGHRFVGRAEVLAALFRNLEVARAGRAACVAIVGPPGIGKSRVLNEFEGRIRPRAARVARVRFLPAMREIPGSALAEFARALCALPGAMGISETSAAALVELLPELCARFPSAPVLPVSTGDLSRIRAAAVADLVAAVSEDRLTVVLRDDDHNMDPLSRAVLENALRRDDLRLLEVRTSRTQAADHRGCEEIVLAPLSALEVRHLFEGVGRLPDEAWVDPAIERLTSRAAGIPQLLLLRLRALGERGTLRLEGESWRVDDPAAFVAPPNGGVGELAEAVGGLHPSARLVLTMLSQWRRPLKEPDALAVLGALDPSRPGGEWRSALAELELRGLIAVRDEGWAVAHETIAESCLEAQRLAEAEQLQFVFIRRWSESGPRTVPVLEHLALLCGTRNMRNAAVFLVRLAARERSLRRVGLRGRSLAQRVASAAGHPEWEPELFDAIGWIQRRSRRSLLGLGLLAGAAAGMFFWLGWMLWPRLVVESQPMAEAGGMGPLGSSELAIQPRVGIYNGFGRRLEGYDGQVRARVGGRMLVGDTTRTLEDGLAQFEHLVIAGFTPGVPIDSGEPEFVFTSTGIARSAHTRLTGGWLNAVDEFRVVSASLNGAPLDSTLRARVDAGDTLNFVVTFEYSATGTTRNYVVGAAPTWSPHETSTIRLAGLPRPVRNAWRTVSFSIVSPKRTGLQHVIVLMGAEDSVDHLFSMTSWTIGLPIWNDGNDVQGMTLEEIRELRSRGKVWRSKLESDYRGKQADLRIGSVIMSRGEQTGPRSKSDLLMGTAFEIEFVAGGRGPAWSR